MSGPLSTYVQRQLANLLDEHRIVVWYDAQRFFAEILPALTIARTTIIDAGASILRARHDADRLLTKLGSKTEREYTLAQVLIYCPWQRDTRPDYATADPFANYAAIGSTFGDRPQHSPRSLATQALPALEADIAALFEQGSPDLGMVDGLGSRPGAESPLVKKALSTDYPVDCITQLIGNFKPTCDRLDAVEGSAYQLAELLGQYLGWERPANKRKASEIFDRFPQFLLLSEFAFDLPGELPEALGNLPQAAAAKRDIVYHCCDSVRDNSTCRDGYIKCAERLEDELKLKALCADTVALGCRDTFPFEMLTYLRQVQEKALAGELKEAQAIVRSRAASIWRQVAEYNLAWKFAEHALELLRACDDQQGHLPTSGTSVREHVEIYGREDGLWLIDRIQRRLESVATNLVDKEALAPLLEHARKTYRRIIDKEQDCFLSAVKREHWPPDGVRLQKQAWKHMVQPAIDKGERVAFFWVDALRYEMGRDLEEGLHKVGSVSLEYAACVMPTSTPYGMAALLPEADQSWEIIERNGELMPAVAGQALPGVRERLAFISARYGDRQTDLKLSDVLTKTDKVLTKALKDKDILIVRSQEIDAIGEHMDQLNARRSMENVIGDVTRACHTLARIGFQRIVLTGDHGHVLVPEPEIPPGDIISDPAGIWPGRKRRCRIGKATQSVDGAIRFTPNDLGVDAPAEEFWVASGYRVFGGAAPTCYFHEGLSLQEALVPFIVVECQSTNEASGTGNLTLSYRYEQLRNRIFSIKLAYGGSFLAETLVVRVEVYDGPQAKAAQIGTAQECDARDPGTGFIKIEMGQEVQIPLAINAMVDADDFETADIRVLDSATGAKLAGLTLKNGLME